MYSRDFSIMSYTDVMDMSFNIHKKHMGTSALYLLIFYIISFIISFAILLIGVFSFGFVAFSFIDELQGDFLTGDMSIGSMITFASVFIIIMFLFLLLRFIKEAGIIEIASKGLLNRRVTLEKTIGRAFKNIPAILSVLLSYSVFYLPMLAIYSYLILKLSSMEDFSNFIIGMTILGLSMAGIYAYFTTIFMFSIQAAVIEKLYFFKALNRSRKLVNKSFWRLLGINILFYMIIVAITYSIYSIFEIVGGLFYVIIESLNYDESILTTLMMLGNLFRIPLQILFSLFISPLMGIFLTILYYNQRFKKEGYDMELKLERLKEADKIIKEKDSGKSDTYIDYSKERKV